MRSSRQQKHSGHVQYLSKCLSLHAITGNSERSQRYEGSVLWAAEVMHCAGMWLCVMDLLSVRLLVLQQTGSRLSQSSRPFRRNKVFRRERGAHKGSPPALHLTLSLTPENNKNSKLEGVPRRPARTGCAIGAPERVPGDTMCCSDRTAASIICGSISRFSHRGRCSRPLILPAATGRCLLQLCLIQTPTAIQRQQRAAGVFLGARCSQREREKGAPPNVLTHCEKYPHCILVSCQQRHYLQSVTGSSCRKSLF